jgi:hypothetical protein
MNRDSVYEYILLLKKFKNIYKKYIDSREELSEIFDRKLEKIMKFFIENNRNTAEEGIIKLLKELVKNFSVAYDANESKNKSKNGPRNMDAFKQNIYETEIAELKEWLISNIDNKELFPNFESIIMYVAKKCQMIEFLKLGQNLDRYGKRRIQSDNFSSPLEFTQSQHLIKNFSAGKMINYVSNEKTIPLTVYMFIRNQPSWIHTVPSFHPELFKIMNDLYTKFMSSVNRQNNISKIDILVELYWLYMQTYPFKRGSAAIGEILFSVLLRKYFGCDFFISRGWYESPLIIPDIHALHYELDHFKSIFWKQFTDCKIRPNQNINNVIANRLKRNVIGLDDF